MHHSNGKLHYVCAVCVSLFISDMILMRRFSLYRLFGQLVLQATQQNAYAHLLSRANLQVNMQKNAHRKNIIHFIGNEMCKGSD